jgi:hypothetical protein
MYPVRLTIFIISAILAGALFFLLFFYKPLKRNIWRKNVARMFYNKVNRINLDNDYFLLNDLLLNLSGEYFHIDHVLGGEKYIYVITDKFYEGAIVPSTHDPSWTYYTMKERKQMISNPLLDNRSYIDRLSIVSLVDKRLMIGIVLVNDDCFVAPYTNEPGSSQLIPLSKLEKTIQFYESQDVVPLDQEELRHMFVDLHNLSGRTHGRATNE